jgi:hypothetical protein
VSDVLIEGGRATADPVKGVIRYNFFDLPNRQLTSATWFVKEEKSSKEFILLPMPAEDATVVEELYQRAVSATSSLGEGIDSILLEETLLSDEKYKIMVIKTGSILQMKKKPKGWFGTSYDLQRGYGHYEIEGEEEEMALGPVRHVVFVVHGIGEAMWSRDYADFSLNKELNRTRLAIQRKQLAEWKKQCEKARKAGYEHLIHVLQYVRNLVTFDSPFFLIHREDEPAAPNRIELLPIEWYDHIHNSSSILKKSVNAITIQSIPALRSIANDVIFDVLMYQTPTFCESVLEYVTAQIDSLYHGFNQVHPNFLANGGKCSLVGHSLGSVIVWDLLSILKEFSEPKPKSPGDLHGVTVAPSAAEPLGYQAYATNGENANVAKNGYWGPSLPKAMKKTIPFVPEFTMFLGSPLGLFLTLRGAHAVFDEMREAAVLEAAKKASEASEESLTEDDAVFTFPLASPFALPSGSIFNIFHPSDPVAYRIEPLLLSQDAGEEGIPPPLYLVKPGQNLRLHVQAMRFGDDIRKSFAEKANTWSNLITAVTEQAVSALSKTVEADAKQKSVAAHLRPAELKFALGGKSDRVDFQLQTGVIDNAYLSAVTAHSTYFGNSDVLDFIVDRIE